MDYNTERGWLKKLKETDLDTQGALLRRPKTAKSLHIITLKAIVSNPD